MQITCKNGTIVLDFYPIKDWNNNIDPDNVLRILSFKGETMNKRIVSRHIMGDDILTRINDFDYIVTDNKRGIPQYASLSVENTLNKLTPTEVN
tara:strand:- start:192 stop:473 length:282 start_codon:yes stop_codon:yes gene_type:complete